MNPDLSPLFQQAQQGNVRAIATLLSQSLQTSQLTVTVKCQGSTLKILVEGNETPNQAIVNQIRQSLLEVQPAQVEEVVIYGRQSGNKMPQWSTKLNMGILVNLSRQAPKSPNVSTTNTRSAPSAEAHPTNTPVTQLNKKRRVVGLQKQDFIRALSLSATLSLISVTIYASIDAFPTGKIAYDNTMRTANPWFGPPASFYAVLAFLFTFSEALSVSLLKQFLSSFVPVLCCILPLALLRVWLLKQRGTS